MDKKEIFLKAFEIIKDKKKWTTDLTAKNKDGNWASAISEEAVQWCSIGALSKVSRIFGTESDYIDALDIAESFRKYTPKEIRLPAYNDTHAHSSVVKLWRKVGKGEGWL